MWLVYCNEVYGDNSLEKCRFEYVSMNCAGPNCKMQEINLINPLASKEICLVNFAKLRFVLSFTLPITVFEEKKSFPGTSCFFYFSQSTANKSSEELT